MLGDFEDEAVAAIVGLERGEDRRQHALERDVDDGADDLADAAGRLPVSARLGARPAVARRLLGPLRGLVSGAAVAMSVFLGFCSVRALQRRK